MKSSDIDQITGRDAGVVSLGNLLDRMESPGRAFWSDILNSPGIYVVCLSEWGTLSFTADTGRARCAIPTDVDTLNQKRECILTAESTDILYIGKAGAEKSTLRGRVRALVRFGVGRARNHGGGEWLWQLEGV